MAKKLEATVKALKESLSRMPIDQLIIVQNEIFLQIKKRFVETCSYYAEDIGGKFMVYWPAEGENYPATVKSVDLQSGLIEVAFENEEDGSVTYFLTPDCIGQQL